MSDRKISSVFNVSPRYLRSTVLERDFPDPHSLENYVVTSHARDCLIRLSRGLRPGATDRAWRLTGNYGSGKSSFALLAARWFSGEGAKLGKALGADLDHRSFGLDRAPEFLPVLITGSRESIGRAILRAVLGVMDAQYTRGQKAETLAEIQRTVDGDRIPTDQEVVRWVQWCNAKLIRDGKAKGMLILLDELGKFLEFAAFHPQSEDIFLLQRLAEAATRSDDEPLFVIGLLHQGFSDYASNLDQTAQHEWDKIAGRFEEMLFNQPLVQVSQLVAAALQVKTQQLPPDFRKEAKAGMEAVMNLGWLGQTARRAELEELAPRLFPLHAMVVPALVRVFQRFGQNERSLFSFLLSNEPFGLQTFAGGALAAGHMYRLADFYDYVRANFGYRLANQSYRTHWTLIESMVESFSSADELDQRIVKTVGILNLLDQTELAPTREAIVAAVASGRGVTESRVVAALERLHTGRVLYRRGSSGAYCLWSHTSVDLEAAFERATKAIGSLGQVGAYLKDILETRPLVARRHYIQTGNLRYFSVHYCPVGELEKAVAENPAADGAVVVALCETAQDIAVAEKWARGASAKRHSSVLVAVPNDPLANHAGLVAESMRWEWVAINTPELHGDRYAREEVSRQRAAARFRLEQRIQDLLGLRSFSSSMALRWYCEGKATNIASAKDLLSRVSQMCDGLYSSAPRIRNELINRRSLSSAAAAARQRLIELIFTNAHQCLLGMDATKKPPEMSIYLSVLAKARIHREQAGVWQLVEPHGENDDPCNLGPTFAAIRAYLEKHADSRVSAAALLAHLERPPLGVRAGPAILILAIYAAMHSDEVALYEDGRFLRDVGGDEFLRLAKVADTFELQLCRVAGVRSELFRSLLEVLEFGTAERREGFRVLEVVRPLCQFLARLPDVVLNSRRLGAQTLAARDVILQSADPGKLLFQELPEACGLKAFGSHHKAGTVEGRQFAQRLRDIVDELREYYPNLLEKMRAAVREHFGVAGSFPEVRRKLAARARPLTMVATEIKLKSLCLRLADEKLADDTWLESLGSLVSLQPPARWKDSDEDMFHRDIAALAARFRSLESIAFAKKDAGEWSEAFRLALTRSDGSELQEVVYIEKDEQAAVDALAAEMTRMMSKNRRVGVAALTKIAWSKLERK